MSISADRNKNGLKVEVILYSLLLTRSYSTNITPFPWLQCLVVYIPMQLQMGLIIIEAVYRKLFVFYITF